MIDLRGKPFYLNDYQIKWVKDTLDNMSLKEKVGQLFCPMGLNDDINLLKHQIVDIGIGGIMYRMGDSTYIRNAHKKIQSLAKIPLLIAANTEAGGNGLLLEGTSFGSPMNVAATGDPENAYKMGYAACFEGAATGLNWSFAPIVDINYDFHNPITNTRTFGSNPDTVLKFASNYLKAAEENNVAACIKHFPGDGVDERDQHILTSVNSLDYETWKQTYGKVYQNLIFQGAKTLMVGHIALPSFVRRVNPNATKEEKLLPGSINKYIINGLLRNELKFNGLVVTDSTAMVGFTSAMPREKSIPLAINAGADMILFNKSLDEDYFFLIQGIEKGLVTIERIDEAVTRILATKASINLNDKQKDNTLVPEETALVNIGNDKFKGWAKEVISKSITLVKDENKILPLSVKKYKRIYLNVISKDLNPNSHLINKLKEKLEAEGFKVTVRDRRVSIETSDFIAEKLPKEKAQLMDELYRSIEKTKENYDLYLYVCDMQNASNNTTLRLNWNVVFGLGDDAPWFTKEVDTMMVSLGYPYHLYDAPMIKTYINAYSNNDMVIDSLIEKIMGRSKFEGVSPIDPYCGKDFI